jgi:hypothetical protein
LWTETPVFCGIARGVARKCWLTKANVINNPAAGEVEEGIEEETQPLKPLRALKLRAGAVSGGTNSWLDTRA